MSVGEIVRTKGNEVLTTLPEASVVDVARLMSDRRVGLVVVQTCSPSNDARDIMRIMHEGRFRHMPVVEHGNLKGLVSVGDILEYLKEQSELHSNSEAWEELNFL